MRCCPWNMKCGCCGPHDHQGDMKATKGNRVLYWIALAYSRRPFLILFLTLTASVLLSKFGVSENGFPEFEDPYLGFETRFTPLAHRLTTLENIRKEVNNLGLLENYPGERASGRELRRRRRRGIIYDDDDSTINNPGENYDEITLPMSPSDDEDVNLEMDMDMDLDDFLEGGYCTKVPYDDYSRVALEISQGLDIFSHQTFMLLCYFQKLTEVLPEYGSVCEHDNENNCCPMWSFPNYVADYVNKSDCSGVKEPDIHEFQESLAFCKSIYNDTLKFEACSVKQGGPLCPEKCQKDGPIYGAMFLTLDNGYGVDKPVQYSMIILPIPKSRGSRIRVAKLENALTSIKLPEPGVELAGYDFGDKDWIFKKHLISDLQYVLGGSLVVFFIVIAYTKSFSVTLISFFVLLLSLGVSYFLYTVVFQIPYFPFMNMLVTIIVMGIGTDGTLILGAEWERLKDKHVPTGATGVLSEDQKTLDKIMLSLLEETTAPLIVTTLTTAGAFLASLTSSITTIKCFSIFAGTSIITSFVLLYLCVPTTLLLSDLCISYLTMLFSSESSSPSSVPHPSSDSKISVKLIKAISSLRTFILLPVTKLHPFYKRIKRFIKRKATFLWTLSFLTLLTLLGWSCHTVFYNPGYQLPNSEQFQLLSKNHPIERFDREVEPRFQYGSTVDMEDDKMTLYFIWGVLPLDSGFGLDPNSDGTLTFDPKFTLEPQKNQKWMRKLCGKLRKQGWYDKVSNSVVGAHYDSCFLDTMVKWMKRECNNSFTSYEPCCHSSRFPYTPEVFGKCVQVAAKDLYRTPSPYFKPDIAGPKFHVLKENSPNSSSLATFILRVKTNVSFSLSFEKMDSFYQVVDNFFHKEIKGVNKTPPVGLEGGFFVSAHLDFYDLQKALANDTWQSVLISGALCFAFLWIFSGDLMVSLGAVGCILAIVIVSSSLLISLFSWKLGVFESIAVTVAVGLSDFTAHHSLEYSKRRSVLKMVSPTFFSATTTITIGLSMLLFSNVLVYQQIGLFFTVLILVSWIYSVFFLSPILDLLEKLRDLCSSIGRICRVGHGLKGISGGGGSSSSAFTRRRTRVLDKTDDEIEERQSETDNVSAIIFSNPSASNLSRSGNSLVDDDNEGEGPVVLLPSPTPPAPPSSRWPSRHSINNKNNNSSNNDELMDPSAIIEKVKLLKKMAAETSV